MENSSSTQATVSENSTSTNTSTSNPAATTSLIPQEATGSWTGTSLQAVDVSVTITADGKITTSANFGSEGVDDIRESSAVITGLKTIAPNTYIITSYTGDFDALLPGITGLGGVGVIKSGFKIENGQYTPISVSGQVKRN